MTTFTTSGFQPIVEIKEREIQWLRENGGMDAPKPDGGIIAGALEQFFLVIDSLFLVYIGILGVFFWGKI